MYKELIDKVSDEHEQYLDYLLLNSRASLIDRSAEIYIKNAITNKLISEAKKDHSTIDNRMCEKMMLTDSIVDCIYLMAGKKVVLAADGITDASWQEMLVSLCHKNLLNF